MKRFCSLAIVLMVAAAPAFAQTATDILNAHIEAVGGSEAWSQVESSHTKLSVSVEIPQGVIVLDVEAWTLYPGYAYLTQTPVSVPDGLPNLSSRVYVSPEEAWAEGFQGRQELDPANPQAAGNVPSTTFALQEMEILAQMDSVAVEVLGQEEIGGKMTNVLQIGGATATKRYYDVETGLLAATEANSPMGTMLMRVSEYQDYDGLKVALIQEGSMSAGGQSMTQTMAVTAFHTNMGFTAADLAEKAAADM